MTDQPYTDEDLRAEAAKQHATTTQDADFCGIGERMEGSKIESSDDLQWDQLDEDQFDTAQRAIDDLLGKAADVSGWAVALGADGLTPGEFHLVDGGEGGPAQAAFHIALDPSLEVDPRAVEEIADILRNGLRFRDGI